MKAILEFNLPEERIEYHVANRGGDYLACLEEIISHYRAKQKYEDGSLTITYDDLYQQLWAFLAERNIDVWNEES